MKTYTNSESNFWKNLQLFYVKKSELNRRKKAENLKMKLQEKMVKLGITKNDLLAILEATE